MDDIHRLARSVGGILRTHYPAFLFGLPLRRAEIPVFIYHDVEPEHFRGDLEFLARNGYRTSSLDEFMSGAGGTDASSRRVLLTFDDGRASFPHTALPLLRAFDARAALFVPTYWMQHAASSREPTSDLFMSWDQVREVAQSGLVDVQAHAHRHALVFTSERIAAFASPATLARHDIYDWPMRHRCGADELGQPELGTPIYRAAPLLSAASRFLENEQLTDDCTNLVRQAGGSEFFTRSDWPVRLRRVHAFASERLRGRYLPDAAFSDLVASELELCRATFQEQLGYAPRYFAYPWMLGSRQSLEIARRCGIKAAFGVAQDYRVAHAKRLPLPVYGRMKADWLRLLPGRGRASLSAIACRKLASFSKLQHLAH